MVKSYFTKHVSKFHNLRTRKYLSLHFTKYSVLKKILSPQFTNHSTLSAETYSVCLETNTNNFLRTYGNLFVFTHISASFRRKL